LFGLRLILKLGQHGPIGPGLRLPGIYHHHASQVFLRLGIIFGINIVIRK